MMGDKPVVPEGGAPGVAVGTDDAGGTSLPGTLSASGAREGGAVCPSLSLFPLRWIASP